MADGSTGFLFCLPKEGPGKTIMLKEKYGETRIVDGVNIVGFANGEIIVTRHGDVYGRFSEDNWAVSIVEDQPLSPLPMA